MDLGVRDHVAIITGASKGIGLATARALGIEGCHLVISARDRPNLERAADSLRAECGVDVLAIDGDMGLRDDVQRMVDAAIERFSRIDILVTCAGSSPGGLLEDLTEEQFFGSLNLKLMGYVRTCQIVIPHMKAAGSGSIVLVVGNDGLKPSYWELTAGLANAADINFAASLAEQYAPFGIRTNTINPGPVNTDRWDGLEKAFARDKGVSQDRAHELAVASIPIGRICEADEVANLVAFIASPRASFVNGAHIPIDGAQRKGIMDT